MITDPRFYKQIKCIVNDLFSTQLTSIEAKSFENVFRALLSKQFFEIC